MKQTIYLDSTGFSTLTCPMAFKHTVVEGLVPISGGLSQNYKVAYGSAFHLFISTWHETHNEELGISKALELYSKIPVPESSWMTSGHLVQVCQDYLKEYQDNDPMTPILNKEGKPLVEYTFKFPIYEDPSLEIILFGKIDLVCRIDDMIIVMDHKTTGALSPMEYFEGYKLSSQMMLYTWVLGKLGDLAHLGPEFRNPLGVIDGIFLQKPSVRNDKNPPARFLRSPIIDYSQHRGLFFSLLSSKIQDIVNWTKYGYTKEGILNKSCAGKWGKPCDFHRACKATSPEEEQSILLSDFVKETYDATKLEVE